MNALVLVHRRQDPLDDDELLEAGDAALDREEELGHAAGRELAEQGVLAEPPRQALHVAVVARLFDVGAAGRRRRYVLCVHQRTSRENVVPAYMPVNRAPTARAREFM